MPRPTKKQQRIKEAKKLLENQTLLEIFSERDREIYERWKGSANAGVREECYHEIRALDGLRDAIYAAGTDED